MRGLRRCPRRVLAELTTRGDLRTRTLPRGLLRDVMVGGLLPARMVPRGLLEGMDRPLLTEALGRLLLTEALGLLLLTDELDRLLLTEALGRPLLTEALGRAVDRCLERVLPELVAREDLLTERAGAESGKIAISHAKTIKYVNLLLIMHLLVFWCFGSCLLYLHYTIYIISFSY